MRANISVIIPAYNSEKTIKKCVFSLLNQSYPYFKIIVVNDGSTDNTLDVLKKINDSRVKVISQPNKGVSIARNNGLSYVVTKYVAFVDADDYVGKDYLQKLIEGYNFDNIGLSIGGYKEVNNTNNIVEISFKEKIYSTGDLLNNILTNNGVMGFLWNKLWQTDIIKKYSLRFNSKINMAEDLLFAIEYIKHIQYAYVIKNCDYYHVYCEYSLSSQTSIKKLSSKYKESYNSFLTAEKEILKIIPSKNVAARNTAKAKFAITCANFLRALELDDGNKKEDQILKKQLKRICISYTRIIIGRKGSISVREKIVFIMATYMSFIMKIIDKYRK